MSEPWTSYTDFLQEDHAQAQPPAQSANSRLPSTTWHHGYYPTLQQHSTQSHPALQSIEPQKSNVSDRYFTNSFMGAPSQQSSRAASTTAEPESQNDQRGAKLDDSQRLAVLSICVAYQKIYLDDKPMKAFWKAVTRKFLEKTGNKHSTLDHVVKRMVAQRERHLANCGTGTEPDGGELNQRLDKWREVLAQKDAMKDKKKKTTEEVLRDAEASKIDRLNMKLSLSQKRNRDEAFTDLSDSGSETDEIDESDVFLDQSNPTSSSPRLAGSFPTLQRKRSARPPPQKISKKSPRKSSLSNEVRWVDMFKETAAIIADPVNEETTTRLAALEESQKHLAEGHAELKTQSSQMLSLLKLIHEKMDQ